MIKKWAWLVWLSLGGLIACTENEEDDRYEAAQRAVTQIASEDSPASPKPAHAIIDWTPVFQPWENGCEDSEVLKSLQDNLITYGYVADGMDNQPSDDKPKLGKVVLPMPYQDSVLAAKLEEKDDYSDIVLPLKNSEYYGVAIDSIVFYRGHGSGVSGAMLVFSEPVLNVKPKLSKVKYKPSLEPLEATGETVQAAIEVYSPKQAALMCDWSH